MVRARPSLTGLTLVYNIDFADEFRSWDTDPLKLFSAKIIKEPADKKVGRTAFLIKC